MGKCTPELMRSAEGKELIQNSEFRIQNYPPAGGELLKDENLKMVEETAYENVSGFFELKL